MVAGAVCVKLIGPIGAVFILGGTVIMCGCAVQFTMPASEFSGYTASQSK